MEEIVIIKILVSIIYMGLFIGIAASIINGLYTGRVRHWLRGYPLNRSFLLKTLPNLKKYELAGIVQKNHLLFDKKRFPTEYWAFLRTKLIILGFLIILGVIIYTKLF